MEAQIKSKMLVADHGEVLTGERQVNAMLDLLPSELWRDPKAITDCEIAFIEKVVRPKEASDE